MAHWEVWSYDVWGNRDDGYEVNHRHCINRRFEASDNPTDDEIRQAFDFSPEVPFDTDGDDQYLEVTLAKDFEDYDVGYPLGEMVKIEA